MIDIRLEDSPYFFQQVRATQHALFVEDFPTIQDAVDALVSSPSYSQLVFQSNAVYALGANILINGLTSGKTIDGNGATLNLSGSGRYGFDFRNSTQATIKNFKFVGSGINDNQTAIVSVGNNACTIRNNLFYNLFQMYAEASSHENFKDNYGSDLSTGISGQGEYLFVTNNHITGALVSAMTIQSTGNVYVIGNRLYSNAIGVFVDSSGGGNADHGLISNNSINHSSKAGIYLKNLIYSMNITGNEIWATNFGLLGSGAKNAAFGIYVENGTGVGITSNTIARNQFNLAFEGIRDSIVGHNRFIGDPSVTVWHIKEVGGVNADYLLDGNFFDKRVSNPVVLATHCPNAMQGTNLF